MRIAQAAVRAFHVRFGHAVADMPTTEKVRGRLRARLIGEELAELCEALGVPCQITIGASKLDDRGLPLPGHDLPHCFEHRPEPGCEGKVNLVHAADACADLAYVVLGTAVELGIDLWRCFLEVHRANMSKSTAHAADGKTLKGEAYQPPDLARVLAEQSSLIDDNGDSI